jgi:hypothetical protein
MNIFILLLTLSLTINILLIRIFLLISFISLITGLPSLYIGIIIPNFWVRFRYYYKMYT